MSYGGERVGEQLGSSLGDEHSLGNLYRGMTPLLTIAIPSYDRSAQLRDLLRSIAVAAAARAKSQPPVSAPSEVVEVVVVLDGSTDGSAKMLDELAATFPVSLRHVWQPNRGLSAARNAAIDMATGLVTWLVDDDMTITQTAFDRHLRHDRSESPILMGPCAVADVTRDSEGMASFYDARHARLRATGIVERAADCSFANTSAPTSLLRANRFDERFVGYGMEDYDLAERLLGDGIRVAFDGDALAHHHVEVTRKARLHKLRQEGANRSRFVHKHPHQRDLVFPSQPARWERGVREFSRRGMTRPLWAAARVIDAASAVVPLGGHRSRVNYWAETCAVYSGIRSERTSDPEITVVIPARNAASTLPAVIANLSRQTSDAWRAVVIDDCSTDDTSGIARRWAAEDSRVLFLSSGSPADRGAGVSAARNEGIAAATTDWLLFLDADDRIADNYIERIVGVLERAAADVDGVTCSWAYETPDHRTERWNDRRLVDGMDIFEIAARSCPFAIHACVIRRELVQEVGGFDPTLAVGEDWDLWQRLARQGLRLESIDETLAFYLLHPASAMHNDPFGVLHQSLKVFRRGHSNDLRVPRPRAPYVNGLELEPGIDVVAETVAWMLALAVSDNVDLSEVLRPRQVTVAFELDPAVIAGTLFESVPFARCRLVSDWPEIWESIEGPLVEALDRFGEWSGHPAVTDPVMRQLEWIVLNHVQVAEPTRLGRSLGMRVDVASGVKPFQPADGADRLVASVFADGAAVGMIDVPITAGRLEPTEIEASIREELGPRLVRVSLRRPRLLARALAGMDASHLIEASVRFVLDFPGRDRAAMSEVVNSFGRWFARDVFARGLLPAKEPNRPEPVTQSSDRPCVDAGASPGDSFGQDYFETVFEVDDPWSYTTPYEQTKYEQTLSLLDGIVVEQALELACAEGHFTQMLAPRVGALIATDIAPTALQRAADRNAGLTNVDFRRLDLREDELPADLDLIVCSEVLYFLRDEAALIELGGRFADALQAGGHLLTAHANLIGDEPSSSGFLWHHPFGGKRIGEVLASVPGLELRREVVTELYRIQLFQRSSGAMHEHVDAVVEHRDHASDLDQDLKRMVVWGGITITPMHAIETELTPRLPILMYHRISPTGADRLSRYRMHPDELEAQLAELRRQGYYGITLERWQHAIAEHRALPGRAVMLTFDDGYTDFVEHAWPLLDAYGFPATVFIVTDEVGGSAGWDERFGDPASLMSWDEIEFLQRSGIAFGSHTRVHDALTDLPAVQAVDNERRARSELRRRLGHEVTALAYPYGAHDASVRRSMRSVGYTLGLTSEPGFSTVWDDPMRIPRLEMAGGQDLDEFRARLAGPSPHNPIRRIRASTRSSTAS